MEVEDEACFNVDSGYECMSASIMSDGAPSPVFVFREHVFDKVALFIQMPVVRSLLFPVLLPRGTGNDIAVRERLSDLVTVVSRSPMTSDVSSGRLFSSASAPLTSLTCPTVR